MGVSSEDKGRLEEETVRDTLAQAGVRTWEAVDARSLRSSGELGRGADVCRSKGTGGGLRGSYTPCEFNRQSELLGHWLAWVL